MFLIGIQPHITAYAILSELNGMPAIGLLETRKAYIRNTQLFRSQKTFERLGETICQRLDSGGWYMLTTTALEPCCQIVLRRKRTLLCVLCLNGLQHFIIDDARFHQALHEQLRLFLIHEETIFKRSHSPSCNRVGIEGQQFVPPAWAAIHPHS